MLKPLFGGGVALTGALLLASLTLSANSSVAENLAVSNQENQQQQPEQQPADTLAPAETTSAGAAAAKLPEGVVGKINPNEPTASNPPAAGQAGKNTTNTRPQAFTATAYALRGRTASGQYVRRGVIAADKRVLPLGAKVRVEAGSYTGVYTVADRGGAVRGRKIDIWVPSNGEAMRFGRRPVKLTVLSYDGGRKAARRVGARR